MPDEYITTALHEEYARRMEDEHRRMNHRLEDLEEATREISSLAVSVHSLAESIQRMCTEQERQSARLQALEGRDGEKWRAIVKQIGVALVGALAGYVAAQLGLT